ncbi:hypothetical protein LGM71_08820 [Burkholderia sp. AU33545]|uniref:hypothetical protein n=1 Tax=Burkholderia sp. AU33545 TaxID=2879631 RepID=UPI001CF57BEA|nr:hypothetical protein [Burkholderia sp. AU33545]MCA8201150.1 hypothetical protein [Burkholderia sp. AU33545]
MIIIDEDEMSWCDWMGLDGARRCARAGRGRVRGRGIVKIERIIGFLPNWLIQFMG